jgi:hypothetical protein
MLTRCALAAALLLIPLTTALAADVPEQRLDAVYDPVERTIRGHLDVTLDPPTDTVYFLLLANLARDRNPYVSNRAIDSEYPFGFESAALAVESVLLVQSESEAALPFRLLAIPPDFQTYSLDESILAVDVSTAGDHPTLRIAFTTDAPRTASGDNGVTKGILTWRLGWYPLLLDYQEAIVESDGEVSYGPSAAFPLVLPWAQMDATLSAPADMVFLSGGDRIESEDASDDPDGLSVHRTSFTSPTRLFGVTVGEGYRRFVLDGPTPIEVAYLAGHEEEARLFATYAREIIEHYEERFGTYPRDRMTIVENTNTTGASFAADGIVWLSSLYFTHRNVLLPGILNRFVEYVLAHEIAHQWFGLGTGVDLDTDAWLSEGLAQYASISYFETRHGSASGNLFEVVGPGLLEEVVDRQFGFYNLREHQVELPYLFALWSGFDEAIVKPTREIEYANEDVVRLYDKGYLVARAIAAAVGEEAFDRALRAAVESNRASRLDTLGLERFLEEEAGRPLDALFSAWVFGDVSADYAVKIASERRIEAGYETTVTVTRDGGIPQAIEVEARLTSGATARQTWDGAQAEDRLVFRTPSRVRRVTIDPEHRLPDRNRLNNNDPVKIVTVVDRAALPLDAYTLSPNPSTGGFTFAWLDRFAVAVGENSAAMIVREGRHDEYSASVSIDASRLSGEVAYTYTSYARPETGSAATYWEPDVRLTASAARLFSGDDPIWALQLSAVGLPSVGHSHAESVAVGITEGGATRLALSAFDEVRLLPQLYLQGVGTLGFSVGDLPAPLRFSFSELRTDSLGPARNKLTGEVALDLTSESEPYNLANLAMVDRNRTRLFLAGGLGWTTLEDWGKRSPHVEAGVEQIVELSTLGGLLPFTVRLGIATPVSGPGLTVFYVEISL